MGQRLNLTLQMAKGITLNTYFHWAGYTESSIELGIKLGEAYLNDDFKDVEDSIVKGVKMFEHLGASLSKHEKEYIKNHFKEELVKELINGRKIDRNSGLINVSPKGVLETKYWEEANVTMMTYEKDFVKKEDGNLEDVEVKVEPRFFLECFSKLNKKDLREYYEGEEIPVNPFDGITNFFNISLDDMKSILRTLKEKDFDAFCIKKGNSETYYSVIR